MPVSFKQSSQRLKRRRCLRAGRLPKLIGKFALPLVLAVCAVLPGRLNCTGKVVADEPVLYQEGHILNARLVEAHNPTDPPFALDVTVELTEPKPLLLLVQAPAGEGESYALRPSVGSYVTGRGYFHSGPGKYEIAVCRQDGRRLYYLLSFRVEYSGPAPNRYLLPTSLVQSDDPKIKSLAERLARGRKGPRRAITALHDWVAQNITYDFAAATGQTAVPPVDARSVLSRRTAVCEGFANLFAALVRSLGLECIVMTGRAWNGTAWMPHAWNAVKLDGVWQPVDVTWDAGFLTPDGFVAGFNRFHLFPDPAVFFYSHQPESWGPVPSPENIKPPPEAYAGYRHGVGMAYEQPACGVITTARPQVHLKGWIEGRDVVVLVQKDGERAFINAGNGTYDLTVELPFGPGEYEVLIGYQLEDGTWKGLLGYRVTLKG